MWWIARFAIEREGCWVHVSQSHSHCLKANATNGLACARKEHSENAVRRSTRVLRLRSNQTFSRFVPEMEFGQSRATAFQLLRATLKMLQVVSEGFLISRT